VTVRGLTVVNVEVTEFGLPSTPVPVAVTE
jgi:hypothetical protein